jgi:hypothetical protein
MYQMSNGATCMLCEATPITASGFPFSGCTLASNTSSSGALRDLPGVGCVASSHVHAGSFMPGRKLRPSGVLWFGVMPTSHSSW